MITKITREYSLKEYPGLPVSDDLNEKYFFPEVLASYILTNNVKDDADRLSQDVTFLIQKLRITELVFLGETEMGWFSQDSNAEQVKDAYYYFQTQDVGRKYGGGFIVDIEDLPQFVKHLFWLTRLNASFPIVYFIDKGQGMLGNLCKYGNLHINILKEQISESFPDAVNNSKFEYQEGWQC